MKVSLLAVLVLLAGGSARGDDVWFSNKASVCPQARGNGPCDAPDLTEIFVIPSVIWSPSIEGSGCPEAQRAELTAKLESEAALFNGGAYGVGKCVARQMKAQDSSSCPQAHAAFVRYMGKQRRLFYSRWQKVVQAFLASCPPPAKTAGKPRKRDFRAPSCRSRASLEGVAGGCEAVRKPNRTVEAYESNLIHASVRSCPPAIQQRTGLITTTHAAVFKLGREFCRAAANNFLQAQAGAGCEETLEAYAENDESMAGTFQAVWLDKTAQTGAACQAGGN